MSDVDLLEVHTTPSAAPATASHWRLVVLEISGQRKELLFCLPGDREAYGSIVGSPEFVGDKEISAEDARGFEAGNLQHAVHKSAAAALPDAVID